MRRGHLTGTFLSNAVIAMFALISSCQCGPSPTAQIDSYGAKLWEILTTGRPTELSGLVLSKPDYLRLYPREQGDYYERFYLTSTLARLYSIAYDAAAMRALEVSFAGMTVTRIDTFRVSSTNEQFEIIRGSLLLTSADRDTLSRELGTLVEIGGTLKFMDVAMELRSSIKPFSDKPTSTSDFQVIYRVCPDTNIEDCAVVMHGRLVDMGLRHRIWKSEKDRRCFFIALQTSPDHEVSELTMQQVEFAIERLGRIALRILARDNAAAPDRLQLKDSHGNSVTMMRRILLTDRFFIGAMHTPGSASDGIDTLVVGIVKDGMRNIRGVNADNAFGVSIDDSLLCVFPSDPKVEALRIPFPSDSKFWERDYPVFRSGALPCSTVTVERISESALN